MVNKCKYSTQAGCKNCNYTYYKECPSFLKFHYKWLCSEITPFNYVEPKGIVRSSWSHDENKAKSMAFHLAKSRNLKVSKVSSSLAMSMILNNEDIPAGVIYLDISQKPLGDLEKISTVINSFIEKVLSLGQPIAIFKHVNLRGIILNNYPRI